MSSVVRNIIFTILVFSLHGNKILAQSKTHQKINHSSYVKNVVIVKLNSSYQRTESKKNNYLEIKNIHSSLPIKEVHTIQYGKSNSKDNHKNNPSKSLSGIYKLTLTESSTVQKVIKELLKYDNVLYAEPIYYETQLLIPNDANISSQDHLPVIQAYEAWDVTIGSPDIVIGIIDSGMELDHSDLQGQLLSNSSEIINDVDDDGNGFIDDVNGWDFADNDNDPTADNSSHGTRVAGISSAHTNNGIGIAGVGYSSKTVPLKIFTSSDNVSANSYDAIIYAADQGYDVINLSWGSVGTFSQFNQDVINYAAIEHDVVIVAAAGNTDAELDFYPASYDNVLSVAASDVNDNKASFATFSYNIDMIAPGASVFGTENGNAYGVGQGSSFSAPQVAGAAALVKDVFPSMNALQIMQQLRITSDDIYGIGSNATYQDQLGKGRLNVFRAVTETTSPAIRMDGYEYTGIFGEKVFFDDTVSVMMDFTNYLRATNNAEVSISTTSSFVSFLTPTHISLGNLSEMQSLSNQELKFYISKDAPPSERLVFKMDFSDDNGYSDFQYFTITLEPDYLSITNAQFDFTIASNGNLGYATDTLKNGNGFQFEGVKIADQLGIVISNHEDSVSNNIINSYSDFSRDTSFIKVSNLKPLNYHGADQYSRSNFQDSNEPEFALGLNIEQEILVWNDTENSDYLILEYRVSNNTLVQKNNLSFGFYADWNLVDSFQNKSDWDGTNNIAYIYDGNGDTKYAGLALLTNQSSNYHAIDVRSENGNTSEIDVDFSKTEKHNFLSNSKLTAGDVGTGNDVSSLLGANIGTLEVGASEKITFVITAGNSLSDLQNNVLKAQSKYTNFLNSPPTTLIDTACINENFTLIIPNGTNFEIYDDVQMSNLLSSGNGFDFGLLKVDSIAYYRNVDGNFATDISQLEIRLSDPNTNFQLSKDTLFLGDDPLNQIQFTDLSSDAISWQWDFDNGAQATIPNPKISFNETGLYQIDLSIVTASGCSGFVSKSLLVAERSPEPTVNDQTICRNEAALISSVDAINLKFYINEIDPNPIFEGSEFASGTIDDDTIFYVSSIDMVFESNRVPVNIFVDPVKSNYNIRLDTLDLTTKDLLIFDDQSTSSTTIEWFVNDVFIGGDQEQTFTFGNESSLSVKQKALSNLSCSDSLIQVVDFNISPMPQIEDTLLVCKFDSIKVVPTGTDVFYFYGDKELTNLIHKGTSINSGSLQKDSLVFITGVGDFLESDSDSVLLRVIPFETEIVASPESLIIEQGRNVQFTSTNPDVIRWKWFLENEFTESAPSPILKFDTAGIYDILLIAENSVGCLDSAALNYEVRHVTGFNDINDVDISIYPNPTDKILNISNNTGNAIHNLKVHNSLGAEIIHTKVIVGTNHTINVTKLPPGIYLLSGEVNRNSFYRKILIDRM